MKRVRRTGIRRVERGSHRYAGGLSSAGFTLIEVVVSGTLMALILGAAYACLRAGVEAERTLDPRLDALQGGRVAVALLTADLRCAAPLAPDSEWVGLRGEREGARFDRLDFGTLNYTPRRAGVGDFCQVSYRVETDPETGGRVLWRRRNPRLGVDPFSGGVREELVAGVRRFALEYYDGFEWFEAWGDPRERAKAETSNRSVYNVEGMPRAVRISLWLDPARRSGSARERGASGRKVEEPPLRFETVVAVAVPRRWPGGRAQNSGGGE
jgi:type II secretory pathway component PulJ